MNEAAHTSRPTAFFAHQKAAHRRTGVLLVYYCFAIAVIVFAVYCALRLVLPFALERGHVDHEIAFIYPQLLLWSSLGTLLVIGAGTLWRVIELRSGGGAVAEMMGGKLVSPSPVDPALRQLRNVIEEISIASGVPVPEIYVLESERAINAFAAGYAPGDAAIAVTRGCLKHLTRDELQGVIAHEFSHILNGDMRLNIHLLGLLHGLFGIYIAGRVLLEMDWGRTFRRKSGGGVFVVILLGCLLVAIGYLGVLLGRIIQAAVSRQREYLADASAVQFTRNPDGLSGALKKIGGCSSGSRLHSAQAESVSHLFFSNGISDPWLEMMATHPSLDERIRRLDPSFSGKFPRVIEVAEPVAQVANVSPFAAIGRAIPRNAPVIRAADIARRSGRSVSVHYAADLIENIPVSLRNATKNSWSATALMFAFVLGNAPEVRERQLQQLTAFNTALAAETGAYARQLAAFDSRVRLPLLSLALPALRQMSLPQWRQVSALLDQLVGCDGGIDVFEFVLKKIIAHHVEAHWEAKRSALIQYYSFTPLADDFAILLSALANSGSGSATEVLNAFSRGLDKLPMFDGLKLLPIAHCGVAELDRALTRFAQAVPHIRLKLLDACAETVAADGLVNVNEAELIRGIADAINVPLPPLIQGV
ncbi:MAG TPA: M48 family metallopeptidase [Candidatus Acidoferrum sp.]|nr:M48 family metallopeptidase [Candidatus Acidoferrum sp.]